jgi:hypothetical protein
LNKKRGLLECQVKLLQRIYWRGFRLITLELRGYGVAVCNGGWFMVAGDRHLQILLPESEEGLTVTLWSLAGRKDYHFQARVHAPIPEFVGEPFHVPKRQELQRFQVCINLPSVDVQALDIAVNLPAAERPVWHLPPRVQGQGKMHS